MNIHHYVGNVAGVFIGFGLGALLYAFRRRLWARRAHRLARRSDIALPEPLTGRVARFLRDAWLSGMLPSLLVLPLFWWPLTIYNPDRGPHQFAHSYPWFVTAFPVLGIVSSFLSTLWPRWRASGARRVTHLGQVSVGQAFTPVEAVVAVIGATLAAITCLWGLLLVAAPPWWWVVFMAAYGAAVAAWWWAVSTIMGRPTSASDELELGWDDLFRFRQVRSLTAGATWGPPLLIFFFNELAAQPPNSPTLPLVPFYVVCIVALFVYLVFRQGRQLWRRAWSQSLPTP